MAPTGFVTHPVYLEHDTGPGHPERSERLRAILERLGDSGLLDELDAHKPSEAPLEEIEAAHDADHVRRIEEVCAQAPGYVDGDTAVSPASWRAARVAAGGIVAAADRVLDGTWSNAFCAVRPPGHHAERARAMGFCLFNNAAVAALHLLRRGVERVAVIDWDVHHGNGTQHIFETDPRVFYASLHQWPLYPGTGAAGERGVGEGEGTTRNCPMPPGSGEAQWLAAVEDVVLRDLEEFDPGFVIVSAGFDAHRLDPLAAIDLTEESYLALTRLVTAFAAEHCNGRIVSVLEGGYHLDALAASVEAHVGGLVEAGA